MGDLPTHECRVRAEVVAATPKAERPASKHWGQAVTAVVYLGGQWWTIAGQDPAEYATPIRYCPWCGVLLDRPGAIGSGDTQDSEVL